MTIKPQISSLTDEFAVMSAGQAIVAEANLADKAMEIGIGALGR